MKRSIKSDGGYIWRIYIKTPRNVNGITFIEMMVAMAILAIFMAGFASTVTEVFRSFRRVDEKSAVSDLRTLIKLSLSNPSTCAANIDPANFVPTSLSSGLLKVDPAAKGSPDITQGISETNPAIFEIKYGILSAQNALGW
ncbi:MAG: prepilin-type N-terminal cleavage/methylation domain-containing protein [Bdellovibrio sp.]